MALSDTLNINKKRKELEEADKQDTKQLYSDIKQVFGTKQGRRILYWILSICEIYSDNFIGDSSTYYFQGKRAVGLELLELILIVDKEIYIQLLRETDYERWL